MSDQAVDAALPAVPSRVWHLALDTALPAPVEILARGVQTPHTGRSYRADARSVVVLEARGR
jgi:glycogen operon protein